MAGHLVPLAAFFVQPHPGPPPLNVDILNPHLHGRAHARKRVDHERNQRSGLRIVRELSLS